MRQPVDEFAKKLRQLRKARGLAADKLSRLAGVSGGVISKWEREPRSINKQLLQRIAEVLKLSSAEYGDLLKLADLRGLPEPARQFYDPSADLLPRVRDALFAVDHDLDETPSETDVQVICDVVSWVWASWGASGLSPFSSPDLKWPAELYALRIVDPKTRGDDQWDIPDHLIRQELPGLGKLKELTEDTAYSVAHGMAAVYRRWFLSDLARCREAAQLLKRWGYCQLRSVGPVLGLQFNEIDVQRWFGVDSVRCHIVEAVARRELARTVWEADNARPASDSLRRYPFRLDTIDTATLFAFDFAKHYLDGYRGSAPLPLCQAIQDAIYVATSPTWTPPMAPGAVYEPSLLHSLASMVDTGVIKDVPDQGTASDDAREQLVGLWRKVLDTLRAADAEILRQNRIILGLHDSPTCGVPSRQRTQRREASRSERATSEKARRAKKPKATRRAAKRKKAKSPQRKRKRKK